MEKMPSMWPVPSQPFMGHCDSVSLLDIGRLAEGKVDVKRGTAGAGMGKVGDAEEVAVLAGAEVVRSDRG